MKELRALVKRNSKLFFKDKGVFFTSLITPVILLVLYVSFLGNVFRDSFLMSLPEGLSVTEELIGGFVGGQLLSSLLAVSCVTVPFCANMLMVSDKVSGARQDLTVSPVKPSTLALGYYLATLRSSLTVCFIATAVSMVYLASVGWFMSVADVALLLLDVLLLVLFGTALSSIINYFLSSQGQISAVGTIVSSGYGFLCGAYMPISQFSPGLQKLLSFLPGTYGTSLMRNHAMAGVFREMNSLGFPEEAVESVRDAVDCNIYALGDKVEPAVMYAVLTLTVALLIGAYVLINRLGAKKIRKKG